MAHNQVTWKPWQVDTSKLKDSKRAKKRPKDTRSASKTTAPPTAGDTKDGTEEAATSYLGEALPDISREEPPLRYVGNAESRGPRGYDPGNTKDSLFGGGGSRQIPAGLRRMAGGGGGGDYEDDESGGSGDGGSGGGGPGGGGGGGDEGPDLEHLATVRTKQGRFDESRDIQLKILKTATDPGAKLQEMVDGWSKLGENDEAQALQIEYIRSLHNPRERLQDLKHMTKRWWDQNLKRGRRLLLEYARISLANDAEEDYMVSLRHVIHVAIDFQPPEEQIREAPQSSLCGKVFLDLSLMECNTRTLGVSIKLFHEFVRNGKVDVARNLQQTHISVLTDSDQRLTAERYMEGWLNPAYDYLDDANHLKRNILGIVQYDSKKLSIVLPQLCKFLAARRYWVDVNDLISKFHKNLGHYHAQTMQKLELLIKQGIAQNGISEAVANTWRNCTETLPTFIKTEYGYDVLLAGQLKING